MSANTYFKVKAYRAEGEYDAYTAYLIDEYVGYSDIVHEWGWTRNWGGELFYDIQEAKAKMRTNAVRELRAMKLSDGRPVWKIQVVQVVDPHDADEPAETIVWPKEDIPVLDKLAAL